MTQILLSNKIIKLTECCKPIIDKVNHCFQANSHTKIDFLSKDKFYDFRSYKTSSNNIDITTEINNLLYLKIDHILWLNFLDNLLKNTLDTNFYIDQYSLQNAFNSFFNNCNDKNIINIIPKLSAIILDYESRTNIINTDISLTELLLIKSVFKLLSCPLACFTHKKSFQDSFLELLNNLNELVINDKNHYLWYYHLGKEAVISTRLKLVKICIIIVKFFLLI